VNVNTTVATTGATALLLPAQNTREIKLCARKLLVTRRRCGAGGKQITQDQDKLSQPLQLREAAPTRQRRVKVRPSDPRE
jgi:hypothetical protein